MRVFTSYFYQIRFFKPYMIPLSTAVWDPKWYHGFKSQKFTFFDKNGVLNGLRYEVFMPGDTCRDLCRGPESCISKDPDNCSFLNEYSSQLSKINISSVLSDFSSISTSLSNIIKFDQDPIYVLMVHESVSNRCSERRVIQDYFNNNGIFCTELNPHLL